MRYELRPNLPAMPARIYKLDVSEKGYPVPFFVEYIDGKPDFRVIDPDKMSQCMHQDRCWICGGQLGKFKAFVVGPTASINAISAEPPSHLDCATFAVQACPFMLLPKAQRREADLPETLPPGGIMIEENPGISVIWVTQHFSVVLTPQGTIFEMDKPTETIWYTQGRLATREEALQAIKTGMARLVTIQTNANPDANLDGLKSAFHRAMTILPKE